MTRRSGGFRGAKPTWTTTSTSGIFGLEDVVDLKAAGQWPRGPVAPTSLAGTGADTEVALTWVAPATTHGTITNYAVEYTPSGGAATVVLTGSTAASYTVTGLTNDTEYSFRVAGVNHTQGEWSDSVAVTPTVGGWDISNASYVRAFIVAPQETQPNGISFASDGTKMYVVGQSSGAVHEYSLSAAWDISTASHAATFGVSAQESLPLGLFFKPDGSKMFISGSNGDDVNEYSLSTAWSISTASYVRRLSVNAWDIEPAAVFFTPDGQTMFTMGQSFNGPHEWSLSTAWSLSSGTFVRRKGISAQDSLCHGMFFKPDGSRMYMSGRISDSVHEYEMSTPWDVSTLSFVRSFSVSSQTSNPRGLFFDTNGNRMFVTDWANDSILQYSL